MPTMLRYATLALVALLHLPVAAQTAVTWTGDGGDDLWSNGDNWSTDAVPAATDSVVISLDGASVRLTSETTVGALTISQIRTTLDLEAALTVSGTFTRLWAPSRVIVRTTLDVLGETVWRGGALEGPGTLTAQGGLQVTGDGASASFYKDLDGARIVVPSGAEALLAGWYLQAGNGAVVEIEAGATATVTEATQSFSVFTGSTAVPRLVVDGTLRFDVQDGADPRLSWDLDVSGTIEQLSDARFGSLFEALGTLTDRDGTYRALAGTLSLAQTNAVTLGASSVVEGAAGAAVRFAGDSVRVEGTFDVDSLSVNRRGGSTQTVVTIPSLDGVQIGWITMSTRYGAVVVEDTGALEIDGLVIGLRSRLETAGPLTVSGPFELNERGASLVVPAGATIEGPWLWRGGAVEAGTVTARGGLETEGGPGSASWEKYVRSARVVLPSGASASMNGAYLFGRDGAELVIEAGAEATLTEGYRIFWDESGSTTPSTLTVDGLLRFDVTTSNALTPAWSLEGTGTIEAVQVSFNQYSYPNCLSFPTGTLRLSGELRMTGSRGCLRLGGGTLETVVRSDGGTLSAGTIAARDSVGLDGLVRVVYEPGVTPALADSAAFAYTEKGLMALPDSVAIEGGAALGLNAEYRVGADGDSTAVAFELVAAGDPTSSEDGPEAFTVGGVFPNPSLGRAALTLDLPADADVTVEIVDLLGRRVAYETRRLGATRHQVRLTTQALAPGAYVVRVTADDGRAVASGTARFTVVR